MAKTGDTPDRKPKARSRASRPSFAPAAAPAASSAWVYRSDAEAPKPAPAAKKIPRRAPAPVPAVAATTPSGLTHALDVVTLPLAVSLMAVLAPMRWLLGPRH